MVEVEDKKRKKKTNKRKKGYKNKNKNFYCPIEGPQTAKSLQWFINNKQ
jgi:hypothetical protein